MRISIVIPAYNEEKNVSATVEAVLNQDFPKDNFEIIVVDNNSTDKTFEAAERAGAHKIVKEATKGTNIARQRGFEESRGEIVAFLDADSLPPRDWLRNIYQELQKPGVVAVSGPYLYNFDGWRNTAALAYTHRVFKHVDKALYFLFRKKAGVIMGGNFGAWRWAIEKIGGLPPLRFWGDDAAIAIALSRKAGKVVFNPQIEIKSSSRRFEEMGLVRLTTKYAWHYLKIYFSLK